jgi:hypothetical protein
MRKSLLLIAMALIGHYSARSQSTCAQTLRLAQSIYDQGRLQELPQLLEGCLKSGFTQTEEVSAYKLLCLSYIYLEEPEKADEIMLKLLQTDHAFEINESVDASEFIALYRTFRTTSVFSYGFKIGANASTPSVVENYYVGSSAGGKGTYAPLPGFQAGLVFEKGIFQKSNNKFLSSFSVNPEAFFFARNYSYSNPSVFSNDSTGASAAKQAEATYAQTWLDFNTLILFTPRREKNTKYYVGFGPGLSYLLNSSNELVTSRESGNTVSGPSIKTKSSFKPLSYSATVVAGAKIKVGSFFIPLEIRYQYGISVLANASSRSNYELLFDYGFQHNDYTQSNLTFNTGLIIPHFIPKKLRFK